MFGIDDLVLGGLSLGGSLLSGLGAKQSAAKQQKIEQAYEYQNYLLQENYNQQRAALGLLIQNESDGIAVKWSPQNIASDAAKAGFNPVTWANAFGGVYGAMTQVAAQQRVAGLEMQVNPSYMMTAPRTQVPSVMSAIGGAISAGTATLSSAHQNSERVDANNQAAMLQYLASVQSARSRGNWMAGLGTPAFNGMAGQVVGGGGAAAALSLGRRGSQAPKVNEFGIEEKPGQASTPSMMGPGDRSVTGAQTAQDAYDWPLSIPFGAVKFGADLYRRQTGRQFMGDFWSDMADIAPPRMPTERGQAHQVERFDQAFGGQPWPLRWQPRYQGPALPPLNDPYVYGF